VPMRICAATPAMVRGGRDPRWAAARRECSN
jgi:hypothetical protein